MTESSADQIVDSNGIAVTLPEACKDFHRMSFDRLKDTLPTIAQIKAYDVARDVLCGKGK